MSPGRVLAQRAVPGTCVRSTSTMPCSLWHGGGSGACRLIRSISPWATSHILGNVAAFMASDRASSMSAKVANISGGVATSGEAGRRNHMRDLPSGSVTVLFTDIEGSTKLLQLLGDR